MPASGWRSALADPVWLDEIHTAWTTASNLDQVASRAAAGNQGPIYFWLAWFVRQTLEIFPALDPALGLRWISVAAGCSSLGLAVLIVKRWTKSWLACSCTAWLIAWDPTLIFYSTEARPYALMQMLGLVQALCFWHWLNRFEVLVSPPSLKHNPFWRWSDLGLVATTGLLIATHVTAVGLLLAEAVLFVGLSALQILHREARSGLGKAWLSAVMIGGLTAIVLSPSLLHAQQLLSHRQNWEPISDRAQLVSDFDLQLHGNCCCPASHLQWWPSVKCSRGVQGFAGQVRAGIHRQSLTQLSFVGLWGVLPMMTLWGLDYAEIVPAANGRYAQMGTIAIPIFSGLAVGWIAVTAQRAVVSRSVGAALALSSLIVNPWLVSLTRGNLPQLRWEDWGSPITEINRSYPTNPQPVSLFSNLIEDRSAQQNRNLDFQRYLRFPVRGEPELKWEDDQILVYPTLEFQAISANDLQWIEQSGGVWVLIRGQEPLVNEIASLLLQQLNQASLGKLHATTHEREPKPAPEVREAQDKIEANDLNRSRDTWNLQRHVSRRHFGMTSGCYISGNASPEFVDESTNPRFDAIISATKQLRRTNYRQFCLRSTTGSTASSLSSNHYSVAALNASAPPTIGRVNWVSAKSTDTSVPGSGHNVKSRSDEKIIRPIFCPAGMI